MLFSFDSKPKRNQELAEFEMQSSKIEGFAGAAMFLDVLVKFLAFYF